MRKRQTFLLTILTQEDETSCFCGRIKVISSGRTHTFTSLEELYSLISTDMGDAVRQQLLPNNGSEDKALSSKR
jgi:hypothetical protein